MNINGVERQAPGREVSRRSVLGGSLALAASAALPNSLGAQITSRQSAPLFDLLREPDLVRLQALAPSQVVDMIRAGDRWVANGAELTANVTQDGISFLFSAPALPVHRLHIRWHANLSEQTSVLGDAWERSYGDLAWLPLRPDRVLPWYFLCSTGRTVQGAGVKTGPSALAFWQIDTEGVSLWLDLRNGGEGVILGERTLQLATVVQRAQPDESAWQTATGLCKAMTEGEIVPRKRGNYALQTLYGSNDWYYAYGMNTAEGILRDADLMRELAPLDGPKPFCIVDDGYQDPSRFPSMARLAQDIRARHVVPGVWIRPLRAPKSGPANLTLPPSHWVSSRETGAVYDPTIPEARERVLQVVHEACDWGYDFIKHDFTTYELLGQWGFDMGASPTHPGWSYHDRSLTNAEIIRSLYQDIRKAAGPDRVILGCNTIGHLSVGIFDASRTGDDVSGTQWERTRRMGVNTLAFRLPQNGIFFATDADCVPFTPAIPWPHTESWLRAVASSGSVVLVSPDPKAIGPAQKAAIRNAFALAAKQPHSEPLDWMQVATPSRWQISSEVAEFHWLDAVGASPFPA